MIKSLAPDCAAVAAAEVADCCTEAGVVATGCTAELAAGLETGAGAIELAAALETGAGAGVEMLEAGTGAGLRSSQQM